MSKTVLMDTALLLEGYNFTGDHNALALNYAAEMVLTTTFGKDTNTRLGGLKNFDAQLEGYWEAGAGKVDTVYQANIGVAGSVLTIAPRGLTENYPAFFVDGVLGEYSFGGGVGEVATFSVSINTSSSNLVRGTILINAAAATVSGTGTALELGAVTAAQYLYGVIHVTGATADDTLDVIIQSDDAEGFADPTTRMTFTQVTAIGAEFATPIVGPVTDTWWRVGYTIAGVSESFDFTVSMGIM